VVNNKKKVLLVSSAFYPENSPRSFRATELSKELARQGHDVVVYTIRNAEYHDSFEKQFNVQIKPFGKLIFSQIAIKGNTIVRLFRRAVSRTLLMLMEFPDIQLAYLTKKALKNESGYDLLISIAVPHPIHWGVAMSRTAKHPIAKVWVADCGDPYMGAIYDSFKKFFYFKNIEKFFCRKADYISIPLISMRENYYKEFQTKIVEIPQGFRFDQVNLSREPICNSVPTFAFAGLFYRIARNPEPLLTYLASLAIDFKFIVYTQSHDLLTPFKDVLKGKLEIRDYVPRSQLLFELSSMDFLINIGYDAVHQMPSKLIDYFLTGRPVLSLDNNSVDKEMVNQFLAGDYSGKLKIDNLDKFRIENVAGKFLSLADESNGN
jgi:hypothetical protein